MSRAGSLRVKVVHSKFDKDLAINRLSSTTTIKGASLIEESSVK